jgi:hypothetical protein
MTARFTLLHLRYSYRLLNKVCALRMIIKKIVGILFGVRLVTRGTSALMPCKLM